MDTKKNMIDKAAHGSSGLNELKTCVAGLLMSAKKTKSTLSLLVAIFFALPLFAVDEQFFSTNQVCTLQLGHYVGTSLQTVDIRTTIGDMPSRLFRNVCGVRFNPNGSGNIISPNLHGTFIESSSTINYMMRPVKVGESAYPWKFFPQLEQFFVLVEVAFASGLREPVFEYQADLYYNVNFPFLFNEIFFGTNTAFRSSVLSNFSRVNSSLDNIYGDLLSVVANSDDSLFALQSLLRKYQDVNAFASIPFTNFLHNCVNDGTFSQYEAESYQRQYDGLSGFDRQYFDKSIRDFASTARSLSDFLNRAPAHTDELKDLGRTLNDDVKQAVDSGFSASAHFHGATTNLLQRITNQTEQIKQDLQAWRNDATNRLDRQWDGIKKIRENTDEIKADSHVTASGVSKIANDGVKIIGPIQVVQDTGQRFSVNLTDANLSTINNSIASGANEAMQMWLDEWDDFKLSQLPYMSLFSGFFQANTNLLSSIDSHIDSGFTNTLDSIYVALTNGLGAAVTNDIWDYYFDRFKKANEFRDDDGQMFSSIDNQRDLVFGNGFDEAEYKKLDWFSRVELLLYQIGYASSNGVESIESVDLEGKFDNFSEEIESAASAFEGASRRVVGVFSLVGRFAEAIKNSFADMAAPSTDGILLMQGGSWIVQEPLVLRVPVEIQNALRLVFQCIWYLSAFVIGWRILSYCWDRVISLVRWLWSVIDI